MTSRAEIAAFRFGHGLPAAPGAGDVAAMLALLEGPDRAAELWPSHKTADVLPLFQEYKEAKGMGNQAEAGSAEAKRAKKAQRRALQAGGDLQRTAAQAALARAVGSDDPLRERLWAFWCDHFTVTPRNRTMRPWPSALAEEAVRPHLTGRFADMLVAVTLHPAMLIYLDQVNSLGPNSRRGGKRGKGLNENLARELLELHTLGVGAAYTQTDVRELAELLTGLTFVPDRGFAFDGGRVEPGDDVVLGVTYGGEGTAPILAALQDLAVRPETARHLAGKLAVHFVADNPDPGLVSALEAVWLQTGGDLRAVTAALLEHPAAWEPMAAKARMPFDFVAASLRALGLSGDDVVGMAEGPFLRMIVDPWKAMGQGWQTAPGPDGWPEAVTDWITPQGMAARVTWAMEVPGRMVTTMPDPRVFAVSALGERAGERVLFAAKAAESLREGVGLVLASPEFNRR